jgi:DNA recombination protein RmuC
MPVSSFLSFLILLFNAATLLLLWKLQNATPANEEMDKLQDALRKLEDRVAGELRESRRDLEKSLDSLTHRTLSMIEQTSRQQKDLLEYATFQLNRLTQSNTEQIIHLSDTVKEHLERIRNDNDAKLEQMRITVDEKLHLTLEQKLGESFRSVSEQLKNVYESLGKMQALAADVTDLKRVLANVKSRGNLGEVQLEKILEDIFTPDQYLKNPVIKGRQHVEFAIKLPSKQSDQTFILLPIDAKFPQEDYQRLLAAQETGKKELADKALKDLEALIKKEARTIRDKYIDPPATTDFAILFLPFEGLYAEVLRIPGLWEKIQQEHKVVITGPTTLAAFLNSLQMGFRTLAIQKQTGEVWKLLKKIQTDFHKFGDTLVKAKKRLTEAEKAINQAFEDTEKIQKDLDQVQKLPASGNSSPNASAELLHAES